MNNIDKTGWISVIGNPNVGKSTLVNALVGEKLSIVTHKPQTTRHRITAIANGPHWQMVFSDTPGVIKPHYKMQEAMMQKVGEALEDADIILAVTDTEENGFSEDVISKLKKAKLPVIAVLNKIDLAKQDDAAKKLEKIDSQLKPKELIVVSALHGFNVKELKDLLLKYLPEGQPFFPKDHLSDMPERFFASEILREKILMYYQQEIPYSVEVITEEFKESEKITHIRCIIYVNRHSQKGILIGHQGKALKRTATSARIDMEKWLDHKVFLEVLVKVKEDWRNNENHLKHFGYM